MDLPIRAKTYKEIVEGCEHHKESLEYFAHLNASRCRDCNQLVVPVQSNPKKVSIKILGDL